MAESRITSVPPRNLNGISRPGRGAAVVKPKNLKGTLKRLWDLTTGHRKGLGWVLLLSAFSSGASIISPRLTGSIITRISNGDTITTLLLLLAGLYVCDWFVKFMQQFLMAAIGQRIINHIRQVLFGKIKELPLKFFDKHQHGELMSRLTNDVDNISTTISSSITLLMTYIFTIIGIFTMMIILSPLLTMVTLCSVGMIFVLTKVVTRQTRKLFREQQKNLGKENGFIEEMITGQKVVKVQVGDLSIVRDFLDVRDAVAAYLLLIDRGVSGEVYNICSGVGRTLNEVLGIVARIVGIEVEACVDPQRIRTADNKVILGSNEKMRQLGWRPTYSLEASLRDMLTFLN